MAKAAKFARNEVYRVFQVPEPLRDEVKTARSKAGATVKAWLAAAIQQQVPAIVSDLAALGLAPTTGNRRPARLPLTDELVAALQEASRRSGLPQSTLLLAAMRRHAATTAAKSVKRRGGRRRKIAAKDQ